MTVGECLSAFSFQLSAKRVFIIVLPFVFPLFLSGCGIYSLKGTSIPPGMKTVTVQFFENNAPLVVTYLSAKFTGALTDKIRTQSNLSIVKSDRTDADGNFEGAITDYNISNTAIEGNNRAGLLRMTITVSVKYTNVLKPEQGFEQSFSRYIDFKPPLQSVEPQMINEVNKLITDDIFNRAFANW